VKEGIMKRAPLLLALAVALAGCVAYGTGGEPDPERQLQAGLNALAVRDYARAQAHLETVYREHWAEPVGQQALLVLMAAEMDPRNTSRRLWASADMAARLLGIPEAAPWMQPIGETLYLLSLEMGANEERIARAQAALDSVQSLPTFTGQSYPAQIEALETERNNLRQRLDRVLVVRDSIDNELKDRTAELERVRRTIGR
jgi:hypothetical protein